MTTRTGQTDATPLLRVYVTRDVLDRGRIAVRLGRPQTGRPDWLQLNGIKVGVDPLGAKKRVVVKPYWHASWKEAVADVLRQVDAAEEAALRAIEREQRRLEKVRSLRVKYAGKKAPEEGDLEEPDEPQGPDM